LDPTLFKKNEKKQQTDFQWNDLIKIRADQIDLKNIQLATHVPMSLDTKPISKSSSKPSSKQDIEQDLDKVLKVQGLAKTLSVQFLTNDKTKNRDLRQISIQSEFENITAEAPSALKLPKNIDLIQVDTVITESSLDLKKLFLSRAGTQLTAKGQVRGELMTATALPSDLEVEWSGDLKKMLEFLIEENVLKTLPSGHFTFQGKLSGDLKNIVKTLKAKGELTGERIAFQEFYADSTRLVGEWISDKNGQRVNLQEGVIVSVPKPRQGSRHLGQGGRIKIQSLSYRLGQEEPLSVTLQTENAHVQWLGFLVPKTLYPLDARINGETKVKFYPPKGKKNWKLEANVQWTIPKFIFDNQKYLKEKDKVLQLFNVQDLSIQGPLQVSPENLILSDVRVQLGKEKRTTAVLKGDVNFKKGFNLLAQGSGNLKDIQTIAEKKIDGHGLFDVNVTGPMDGIKINIRTELEDASYLRLYFGKLKGLMVWDDEPSRLLFDHVTAEYPHTLVTANGSIDLGSKNEIDLHLKTQQGEMQDVLYALHEVTEPLGWWYPRDLQGLTQMQIDITGPVDFEAMSIAVKGTGKNWKHWDESFSAVEFEGGYFKGDYELKRFNFKKGHASFDGFVRLQNMKKIAWEVKSQHLNISDFDHIRSLSLPIQSQIEFSSEGSGELGSAESETSLYFSQTQVLNRTLADSSFVLKTAQSIWKGTGQLLGDQAKTDFQISFIDQADNHIQVDLQKFDFSPFLFLINSELLFDQNLLSYLTAHGELNYKTNHLNETNGNIKVDEFILSKTNAHFELDEPISFLIQQGSFNVNNIIFKGPESKSLVTLQSKSGKLNGVIAGRLDLALAEFAAAPIERAMGVLDLNFIIQGTLDQPKFSGVASILKTTEPAQVKLKSFDTPLTHCQGDFIIQQDHLFIRKFYSQLVGGEIKANGELQFFINHWPKIAIDIGLNQPTMKIYPFQKMIASGVLKVEGDDRPYLISGDLLVEEAHSFEKITQNKTAGLKTALYLPKQDNRLVSDSLFNLNIHANAPGKVTFLNEFFDVETKGDLRVVNSLATPRIIGTASVVKGKINFKSHIFNIQEAKAEFDSPLVINPQFSLVALADVAAYKIQMTAEGRLQQYRVDFLSQPSLNTQEILNLLTLGSFKTQELSQADRSNVVQTEAASLVLHSLDFNRELMSKTGFEIGINEASQHPELESVKSALATKVTDSDLATSPKIVIRRQVGQRWGLSAGSTIGVGSTREVELGAEYRLSPGLSLQGVWDSISAQDSTTRTSFGLDFKVEKRFK
jgi:translocation and assembly module TamB